MLRKEARSKSVKMEGLDNSSSCLSGAMLQKCRSSCRIADFYGKKALSFLQNDDVIFMLSAAGHRIGSILWLRSAYSKFMRMPVRIYANAGFGHGRHRREQRAGGTGRRAPSRKSALTATLRFRHRE
jgi:hypothetical protein